LSLVGGGARSAFWAQLLATVLDIEIVTHADSTVGGALGAARLAWLATGASAERVCEAPPVQERYAPQRQEQEVLMARYAEFRRLVHLD
jgi:xylulokinase